MEALDLVFCAWVYLIVVGILYTVVLLVIIPFSLLPVFHRCGSSSLRMIKVSLFFICSLLIGDAFNVLWQAVIQGWLDSDWEVVDFFPFVPIDQAWLHHVFEGSAPELKPGVSLREIQGLWFLFAIATWLITYGTYRFFAHTLEARFLKH